MSKIPTNTAESKNLSMRGNSKCENIESPVASQMTFYDIWERSENDSVGNSDMYAPGQSYSSIVPTTTANNDGTEPSVESDEGRELAKRNIEQANLDSAQTEKHKSRGLFGVREAALLATTHWMHSVWHYVNGR
jgi:hypothetical protein